MKLRLLIADDEPLARERLRNLLQSCDDTEVVAECRNGREAIAAIQAQTIDAALMDIQMPGYGGFEVIQQIGAAKMPVTIFLTAHDQYALRAFEASAFDYLTKPIELKRLQTALERARAQVAAVHALSEQAGRSAAQPGEKAKPGLLQRLLVPHGSKDVLVNVKDIEWIESANYYSSLYVGGRTLLLRTPLKDLANSLDGSRFIRVHRSVIVNLDFVREIIREGRGEGSVVMNCGQRLRMSPSGWQLFVEANRG